MTGGLGQMSRIRDTLYLIEDGLTGTFQTVEQIERLIEKGGHPIDSPNIWLLSTDIKKTVPQRSRLAEAAAAFWWVRNNVVYASDPTGVETISDAETTLRLLRGDCDDMVVLIGSILRQLGHTVQAKTVGMRGDEQQHIYLLTKLENGQWYPLDPTEGFGPGWEVPNPVSGYTYRELGDASLDLYRLAREGFATEPSAVIRQALLDLQSDTRLDFSANAILTAAAHAELHSRTGLGDLADLNRLGGFWAGLWKGIKSVGKAVLGIGTDAVKQIIHEKTGPPQQITIQTPPPDTTMQNVLVYGLLGVGGIMALSAIMQAIKS